MKVVERDLFAEYDEEPTPAVSETEKAEEIEAPVEVIETPTEPAVAEKSVEETAVVEVEEPASVAETVEENTFAEEPIEVDAVEPEPFDDQQTDYVVYEAVPVEEYEAETAYTEYSSSEPLEQEIDTVIPEPAPVIPKSEPVSTAIPEPESPMKGSIGQLFRTFFKIGIVTFGGGYAMIPMIESEVVDKKQWVEKEQFLDLIAISQTCPGVFAINISTFIGYKLRKTPGALLAAFGAALPSFLIILAIAMVFRQFQDIPWVAACFKGIRPAVVALIAVPTFNLAKSAKINLSTCWIPIVGALLICLFEVNPIFVILGAAFLGYLYGMFLNN